MPDVSMTDRMLIVSGADRGYFPLLRDTVLSVRAQRPEASIGILDVGLEPEQRQWLAARVAHLVRPGWDIDFPQRDHTPEGRKAQFARPFLPRHFPGYEIYLWIDADAWLQDWRAIELYVAAAGRDKLAITPEIDRAYKRHYKRPKLFGWTLAWKNYREAFGWRVADRLGRNPMVNCGVFALHRDAPHWEAWRADPRPGGAAHPLFLCRADRAQLRDLRRASAGQFPAGLLQLDAGRRSTGLRCRARPLCRALCAARGDRNHAPRRPGAEDARLSARTASMAAKSKPRCATAKAARCAVPLSPPVQPRRQPGSAEEAAATAAPGDRSVPGRTSKADAQRRDRPAERGLRLRRAFAEARAPCHARTPASCRRRPARSATSARRRAGIRRR